MIKWRPFELHTHTLHSDAVHSLKELATAAKARDLEGFALTDHNTTSGWQECSSMEKEFNLCILKGMECTTFHGHMVLLGLNEYEDWRQFTLENINDKIREIRAKGGTVGIAHPFQMGSPISTGAYWEFNIENWNDINYMEIWHGPLPFKQEYNKRSFALWTSLLNKGYKIAGSYGRDWHHTGTEGQAFAVTYLGINEDKFQDIEKGALDAISSGRMIVTLGPILDFSIETENEGQDILIGEEVIVNDNLKNIKASLALKFTNKRYEWNLKEQMLEANITSNLGIIASTQFSLEDDEKNLSIDVKDLRWLRAELYGIIKDQRQMLAVTSPIYVKKE